MTAVREKEIRPSTLLAATQRTQASPSRLRYRGSLPLNRQRRSLRQPDNLSPTAAHVYTASRYRADNASKSTSTYVVFQHHWGGNQAWNNSRCNCRIRVRHCHDVATLPFRTSTRLEVTETFCTSAAFTALVPDKAAGVGCNGSRCDARVMTQASTTFLARRCKLSGWLAKAPSAFVRHARAGKVKITPPPCSKKPNLRNQKIQKNLNRFIAHPLRSN